MLRKLNWQELSLAARTKNRPKGISVRLVGWVDEKTVFLVREPQPKMLPNGFTKQKGLGLPGGRVEEGELPKTAAEREFCEETGFSKDDFEVDDEPFFGTEKDNGHWDLYFSVRLKNLNPDLSKKSSEEKGRVKEIVIIDPREIEKKEKRYFYRGEMIYAGHVEVINMTRSNN